MDSPSDETSEPIEFSMQLASLKELALIAIARGLWRTPEILKRFLPLDAKSISELRTEYLYNERTTERRVLEQIPLLPLPERFKNQLKPVVCYVGAELFQWLEPFEKASHSGNKPWPDQIFLDYMINDRVRWTGFGTIDAARMGEMLLREDVIPLEDRFELSCKLCLEDEIRRLWGEMDPETSKAAAEKSRSNDIHVTRYWAFKMMNQTWNFPNHLNIYTSPEEYILEQALLRNYPAFGFIFKHFWPKLNPAERNRLESKMQLWRVKIASSNVFEALFCSLNSMTRQRQIEYFRSSPAEFLLKFLTRPWQHLFFPILNLAKDHMNGRSFFTLLHGSMTDQCDIYTKDSFYSELLPLIRKHVHDSDEATANLPLTKNRLEFLKIIMAEAPDAQKQDLISRSFPWEANAEKLEITKVLVAAWLSPGDWPNLKARLMRKCASKDGFESFFQYFDDLFAQNRDLEEGDNGIRVSK